MLLCDRVGALPGSSRSRASPALSTTVGVVAGTAPHRRRRRPRRRAVSPPPPLRALLPVLPTMMLARSLPVPLMLAEPVSSRFSTLAPSVNETLLPTVSVPCPACLDHRVAGIVDDIGVVAGAAFACRRRRCRRPACRCCCRHNRKSLPPRPRSVSLPSKPSSRLTPLCPVSTLASALPPPFTADPVSVRFSILAPSV